MCAAYHEWKMFSFRLRLNEIWPWSHHSIPYSNRFVFVLIPEILAVVRSGIFAFDLYVYKLNASINWMCTPILLVVYLFVFITGQFGQIELNRRTGAFQYIKPVCLLPFFWIWFSVINGSDSPWNYFIASSVKRNSIQIKERSSYQFTHLFVYVSACSHTSFMHTHKEKEKDWKKEN